MATENTANTGTAKKSTRKTSGSKESSSSSSDGTGKRAASAPRAAAPKRLSGSQVAAAAARELLDLTGREAEGVTGLHRTDDGWNVQVEVVEVRRIPDTTDVLALYEVQVDEDGDLMGYRRLRRYARGVPGEN